MHAESTQLRPIERPRLTERLALAALAYLAPILLGAIAGRPSR